MSSMNEAYYHYMLSSGSHGLGPEHAAHDEQLFQVMDSKIQQQIPELIKQEARNLIVDVRTYLNGRFVSDADLKSAVINFVIQEIKNAL